jgi:hypothetical protein
MKEGYQILETLNEFRKFCRAVCPKRRQEWGHTESIFSFFMYVCNFALRLPVKGRK